MAAINTITFEEYLSVKEISYEWSMSYDYKDWDRLRSILAPKLLVDYSNVTGKKYTDMPAEEFVDLMSKQIYGDKMITSTQHLLANDKFIKKSETSIQGSFQIRAAHQRYVDHSQKEVAARSHSHGEMIHYYERIDGRWKLSGFRVGENWFEHSLGEKVFPFMHD